MAVTPLFGVPMDGGAQSFDGVSPTAPQSAMPSAGPKKHSGFDNVLGFLGDFLLSRLKMGTPYHDAREREKLNQARLMDEQDPAGNYANLGALNPEYATRLQNINADNRRSDASFASTAEMRQARIEQQRELRRKEIRNRAASAFNGLDPNAPTFKEDYARTRSLFDESATLAGDSEFIKELHNLYPEDANLNIVHSSIASTIPAAKQWDQAITKERNAAIAEKETAATELGNKKFGETTRHNKAQEGLGAARVAISARRAAAAGSKPPKAPKQTMADQVRTWIDSGKPLTAGQKAVVRKFTEGTGNKDTKAPTVSGW